MFSEYLEAVISRGGDPVFVKNRRHGFVFVNDAACRMFGKSREQLLGKTDHGLFPGKYADIFRRNDDCVFETGKEGSHEEQFTGADGNVRTVVTKRTLYLNETDEKYIVGSMRDITERKRVEEALLESEAVYRALVDSSPVGVYIIQDDLLRFVNRQWCDIYGYTYDEVVDKVDPLDLILPEDRRFVENNLQKRLSGEVDRMEYKMRAIRKDTEIITVKVLGSFVFYKGRPAVSGAIYDITEYERAEERLRQKTALLEAQINASLDGIIVVDKGRKILQNRQVRDLLKFPGHIAESDDEESQMGWVEGLAKDPVQFQAKAAYMHAHPDEAIRDEIELKDGTVLDRYSSPVIGKDGKDYGRIWTFRDITERRRSGKALYASRLQLSEAMDLAHIAYWEFDPAAEVYVFNDPFYALYGTTAEREGGYRMTRESYVKQFLHPDDLPSYAQFLKQIDSNQGPEWVADIEHRIIRRDGEVRHILARARIIRDDSGRVVKRFGANQDITKFKKAEEAFREANHRLEDATARAEMANVAKSEFLANMSHEIRTPMNGVIGMTGLLLDTDLNVEQRHYAETVRNSSESLLALINDILDFSKIEAGKLELEALGFDLRALLDDFAAMMALRAHEKGLEFICAAAPEMPAYVRGDPGRLRQILTNLTGNAVKFTHEGEIAVRTSLVSETDDEAVVRFSIRDTGIGISADNLEALFQKFTQADASTTREYGGTGLGLAISKQLAEMMGGEIGVESEEDRGSEFWFTARFTREPEREQNIAPPAELHGVHILLVDDNATNREVLTAQLGAWGVRVEGAEDGPAALKALYLAKDTGDPFRIAILDMQMPGMDGTALGRAIKADPAFKDTPLVLLSSLGLRGDARKMEDIGFSGYLTKPARQSELFGCLSAVLAGTAMSLPAQSIVTRHTVRELRRGAMRILLAEDNITNQQVAVGILKKLGLRADAVANGAEAIKALETLPYDLVLMDVQMPVLDGLEATRRIRDRSSQVRNHEVAVIAMTAHAMQGDREKCLEAGMNDYVSKPVSPKVLAEALEKWLPKEPTRECTPGEPETHISAGTGEAGAPVFDKTGMMSRLMDDEDLAYTVVAGFLDDIPRQIAVLKGYLDAGDTENVERQAHSIKGASANLGGEALRAAAFKVEKAGKGGSVEAIKARLPELEKQFDLLKEAMKEFTDSGK